MYYDFMSGSHELNGKRVEDMVDGRVRDLRSGAIVCENEDVDIMCQMCVFTLILWIMCSRMDMGGNITIDKVTGMYRSVNKCIKNRRLPETQGPALRKGQPLLPL